MTAPCSHAGLDNYALPLARWRGGSAATLSLVVHLSVAVLVLWRGAVWFESSGGGGRDGDRATVSWVMVPPTTSPHAETSPTPPRRVTGPTDAPPPIERVTLALPPHVMATALPIALRTFLPDPLPGPVGIDEGVSGGPGKGPSCGGGSEVSASPGADAGPASGDGARDMFGPTPSLVPATLGEAPPGDKRTHDVQFWIRADGRVTRIAVSPPIRDLEYRRRFREAMSSFAFGPVKTPDGRTIDYVYNCVVYP